MGPSALVGAPDEALTESSRTRGTTMATIEAPPTTRRPSAARRFGYLVAIAVNAVLLWAANQLLDWGWPGFLTEEFTEVLPLISASLIAGMVVNAGLILRDTRRAKALGDLITAAFGLAISMRLWTVFPFDFSGYGTDWGGAFRVALGVGIAVMAIAVLANLATLINGAAEPDRPG
jgi:hypothetical protein